jgi:hypothetical protein
MKTILILSLVFFGSIDQARADFSQGCPMSNAETLVCSVVLCNPIGLVISESRRECLKVNRAFAVYLSTLGFWDKPPKCKLRDTRCNKVGNASNVSISPQYCDELETVAQQNACKLGLGLYDPAYCSTIEASFERASCICFNVENPDDKAACVAAEER